MPSLCFWRTPTLSEQFYSAAAKGDLVKVSEILNRTDFTSDQLNALSEEKDNWGYRNTPLIIAAKNGHKEVVELLIKDPGIDVNQTDTAGRNTLLAACRFGHHDLFLYLVGTGKFNVNQLDSLNCPPLFYAIPILNLVKPLLEKGALLTAPGADQSALEYARTADTESQYPGQYKEYKECVNYLEQYAKDHPEQKLSLR